MLQTMQGKPAPAQTQCQEQAMGKGAKMSSWWHLPYQAQ